MRNISFSLTTPQIQARTKTVTRRLGWKNLAPGDTLQAVVKSQGLKRGEHPVKLCVIYVNNVRREFLNDISASDCVLEGFPEMSPADFVAMFCAHNNCSPETEITRIEFEYI